MNTLECLEALTRRYSNQLSNHAQTIGGEVCQMISDQDPQKMDLALKVMTNLINANASPGAYQAVVAKAVEAAGSEMIQGHVKETMKSFFKVAAARNVLDDAVPQMLLNFVTLRAQAAAACLAVSIANNQGFRAMLDHLWTMLSSQDSN